MRRELIVACGERGEIGQRGELPWHQPADLRHFRELTTGQAVLMGRVTAESIMMRRGGSLLPNRLNIVVTTNERRTWDGVSVRHIDWGFDLAEASRHDVCYVIGGQQIYALGLQVVTAIEVTRILEVFPAADTFFPIEEICEERGWTRVSFKTIPPDEHNEYPMRFERWEREEPLCLGL